MTACSALLTVSCICFAVMPARSRYSKIGTARLLPEMFSSDVPKPPIWPSMRPSSLVSSSGDEPLVMLVIQSCTVRQSCLLASMSLRHHPIPSMCEFGFGAATVPSQNCGSSLQFLSVIYLGKSGTSLTQRHSRRFYSRRELLRGCKAYLCLEEWTLPERKA